MKNMRLVKSCLPVPGHYTCQIFWKGDPGIEYFTIRFTAEETMRKWAAQVNEQRHKFLEAARNSQAVRAANISTTELQSMTSLGPLGENPYREMEDDDDDDGTASGYNGGFGSEYTLNRNESSTSLRSRSTTGDSINNMGGGRVPPRQFPMGSQAPALQVSTQPQMSQPQSANSPDEFIMDSYFSPTAESPISTRSSGQSGMFPFPRQAIPNVPYADDHNRFTAPALPRQHSRDGPLNGYQVNARNAMNQRPSLPPSAVSTSAMTQSRMRSASSPDIQNVLGPRRIANPSQNGVPDLPPFPTHYAYNPAVLNRSQSSSPQAMGLPANGLPMRTLTQPGQQPRVAHPRSTPLQVQAEYPGGQHPPPMPRGTMQSLDHAMNPQTQPEMRSITPASSISSRIDSGAPTPASMDPRARSPPMQPKPALPAQPRPQQTDDNDLPTQFRVKVHCPTAGTSMTLVVMSNIEYDTLRSRINQKLERNANLSLQSGQYKLKYKDEDDFVNIQSNEDVQMAFESWREQNSAMMGGVGGTQFAEIDFYVH
jgi:cell division control protein 24